MGEEELSGVDLRGAKLARANLVGVDLSEAKLQGANLDSALLIHCDLDDANLRDAILKDASLYSSHLSGADLRGTDLRGANLTHANLTGALYDERTWWPRGFHPEKRGCIRVDAAEDPSIESSTQTVVERPTGMLGEEATECAEVVVLRGGQLP